MSVKLVWITPNTEQIISDLARVSAPENQGLPPDKLLKYLITHKHWSPFEMASACFEINTTRDIARQLLRHRSFSFQEFSQRYSSVGKLELVSVREARLQDTKNRQSSLETNDYELSDWWTDEQNKLKDYSMSLYTEALGKGIAKEVARAVLPEGLTATKMYMSGTIRSWMHFCDLRCSNGTQKETKELAKEISSTLESHLPNSWRELLSI